MSNFLTSWAPALLLSAWQMVLMPLVVYMLMQSAGTCFSYSQLDRAIGGWICLFQANATRTPANRSTARTETDRRRKARHSTDRTARHGTAPARSARTVTEPERQRTATQPTQRKIWLYAARRILRFSRAPLTDRERASLYTQTSPCYGAELGNISGVFLIGLAFSVLWIFWRHSLLYVYIRKYESGGLMWPFIFTRIIWFMVIMVFFSCCVFIVKRAYIQAILLLFLAPLALYRYTGYCELRFEKGIQNLPLLSATDAPKASVEPLVYIPPPLNQRSMGWYPEWGKPWDIHLAAMNWCKLCVQPVVDVCIQCNSGTYSGKPWSSWDIPPSSI
eukprot:gene13269-19111_t